jgi:hypothetical protein
MIEQGTDEERINAVRRNVVVTGSLTSHVPAKYFLPTTIIHHFPLLTHRLLWYS